jgi:hypothetical protein
MGSVGIDQVSLRVQIDRTDMQGLMQAPIRWVSNSKASFMSLMSNGNGGGIGLPCSTAIAAPIAATRSWLLVPTSLRSKYLLWMATSSKWKVLWQPRCTPPGA